MSPQAERCLEKLTEEDFISRALVTLYGAIGASVKVEPDQNHARAEATVLLAAVSRLSGAFPTFRDQLEKTCRD